MLRIGGHLETDRTCDLYLDRYRDRYLHLYLCVPCRALPYLTLDEQLHCFHAAHQRAKVTLWAQRAAVDGDDLVAYPQLT